MALNTYELLENGNTTGWEPRTNAVNGYNAQGMTPLQVSIAAGDREEFATISKDAAVKPLLKTKDGESIYSLAARGIAQRENIGFNAALQTEEYQTLKKSVNNLVGELLKKNKPETLGATTEEGKILKDYLEVAGKDTVSPSQLKTLADFEGQLLNQDRGPIITSIRSTAEHTFKALSQPGK